jgi:hypothetical protein
MLYLVTIILIAFILFEIIFTILTSFIFIAIFYFDKKFKFFYNFILQHQIEFLLSQSL